MLSEEIFTEPSDVLVEAVNSINEADWSAPMTGDELSTFLDNLVKENVDGKI
jgi:hypothetical protein